MERREFIGLLSTLPLAAKALSFPTAVYSRLVHPDKNGKLVYTPDENGNTIPDFSNCGYKGGGVKLPVAPEKAVVTPADGDMRERIQAAIDKVSSLPIDQQGIRGAVILRRGAYKIDGSIRIATSGVVLRGEGQDENGTVLIATKRQQHSLIEIKGPGFGKPSSTAVEIRDDYVPVGAHSFRLMSVKDLRVGANVVVRRVGNKDWIHEI